MEVLLEILNQSKSELVLSPEIAAAEIKECLPSASKLLPFDDVSSEVPCEVYVLQRW